MSVAPVVVGRYALFDEIAAGGMASVQLGRLLGPAGFSRTVAVKRLQHALADDPELSAMILDEARLVSGIHHPNVVSTLDVIATGSELLIVMQYIHGESFARLVASGPVPIGVAAAVLSGTLHGLHAAHEATNARGRSLEIVHRDVSPQNILVGVDGVARIADFGVAKAVGRIQTTRSGQRKGKLAYMAPEQLEEQDVDRRVDVFAAAVVLWEALARRRLFAGETEAETSLRILSLDIQPPSRYVQGVSPELDAIVMRGLARDKSARFATARDMAIAIEDVVALPQPHEVGEWVSSVAAESIAARNAKLAEIEALSNVNITSTAGSAPRTSQRARWIAAAGIGCALTGSAGFVAFGGVLGDGDVPPHHVDLPPTAASSSPGAVSIDRPPAASPPVALTTSPSESHHDARPRPARSAKPAPPTPPPDDCDPPFVLDSTGIRIPKRQCLRAP